MKVTPIDELPDGLLFACDCALESGERKGIELSRHGAIIRVRCRVSADGELASDSICEIRDAEAIGWSELGFGLDVTTRAAGAQRTEHHRF
jgi:hypothetical protein